MKTCYMTCFQGEKIMETMTGVVFEVFEKVVFVGIKGMQEVETSCNICSRLACKKLL